MKTQTRVAVLLGIITLVMGTTILPLQAFAADSDANPPGPAGGPGTNWENPPGHRGGPGASPDRAKWYHWGFRRWLANHPDEKKKYDTNGDGKLDENERKQAQAAWHDEKFNDWTTNHPKAMEKWDANKNGTIDDNEKKEARHHWSQRHKWKWQRDRDNNPPGPAGGAGTNWENPPGPKGGPGTGRNRHRHGW